VGHQGALQAGERGHGAMSVSMTVETNFRDVTSIIGPIVDRNMRELFVDVMVENAKAMSPVAAVNGGTNRASIKQLEGSDGSYAVGTTSGYGAYLEFGTRRMAARPYFLPAAEIAKKNVQASKESDWQS